MEVQHAIKFTRCPRCRAFSLKELHTNKTGRLPEIFSKNLIVCNNCGTQLVLQGNSIKEIANSLQEEEQETRAKEPVVIESRTRSFNRNTIFHIAFLCVIIAAIIILFYPWKQDQREIQASHLPLEEEVKSQEVKEVSPTLPILAEAQKENEEKQIEEKQIEAEETVNISEEPPGTETAGVETLLTGSESTAPGDVPGDDNSLEPVSYKVFELSMLKVRSSSPEYSDQRYRWYFRRKNITIKRSDQQRVFIAGDPTGKRKWAVDDELFINGERIKGCCEKMTNLGYIPESIQMPPHDITHLVPSDRETPLDIRLVDYGVVWGNTPLYIVVM